MVVRWPGGTVGSVRQSGGAGEEGVRGLAKRSVGGVGEGRGGRPGGEADECVGMPKGDGRGSLVTLSDRCLQPGADIPLPGRLFRHLSG